MSLVTQKKIPHEPCWAPPYRLCSGPSLSQDTNRQPQDPGRGPCSLRHRPPLRPAGALAVGGGGRRRKSAWASGRGRGTGASTGLAPGERQPGLRKPSGVDLSPRHSKLQEGKLRPWGGPATASPQRVLGTPGTGSGHEGGQLHSPLLSPIWTEQGVSPSSLSWTWAVMSKALASGAARPGC